MLVFVTVFSLPITGMHVQFWWGNRKKKGQVGKPNRRENNIKMGYEIKSRIAMAKAAFNKKKTLFTSKLDLNLMKKLVKCYIWSMALYGAETWTLRAADQKYLESFEMWCWRRMEKISWTDHVRNEDVLLRANEKTNILHEIRKGKANWIGQILRRNCLLKHLYPKLNGYGDNGERSFKV